MFAKRLLQKAVHHSHLNLPNGSLKSSDLDPAIVIHYGIPSTASVLAFDHVQRLLGIGTLDGRLKVIGGDNIEGLIVSPKHVPYKHLEFLQNLGFLVSASNDNDIQVWSLESRSLVCSLQWESNITAFSVISGSHFIYVGDEHGLVSVLKFEAEEGEISRSPYHVSAKSLRETTGSSYPNDQPIVGVLPQPSSNENRLLIAFEDGLLILWDISEARILFLGGGMDLQLKDEGGNSSTDIDAKLPADTAEQQMGDKEISALCWASSSGSILAVGYVDGDIIFWNMPSGASPKGQQILSSKNVVKLQLSSAERRLPVIVLKWSNSHKSGSDCAGQLFVYGGDEIGSEEVLTVLTLEWPSGMETVNCVGRADLTLNGSFADMILLPNPGGILTNPGQLHFYDSDSLSALISQKKMVPSVSALEFPVVIPTVDPSMTVAKLVRLPTGLNSSTLLSEVAAIMKTGSLPDSATRSKWPITGGVPSQMSMAKNTGVERLYLAGYSDGSVWMCDATHPVLSYICYIEGQVQGIKVAGSSAPVTKLDFCSVSLQVAVGNECGLVRVYYFKGLSEGAKFHFVTDTKCQVHDLPQVKGPQVRAAFSLLSSPVQALSFSNSGTKLAVGFFSGHVAVCDMTSLAVLFLVDGVPSSSSPIISVSWKDESFTNTVVNSPKQPNTTTGNSLEETVYLLSQDGKVNVIDIGTGKMICNRPLHLKESTAISMYVIDDSLSRPEVPNDKQLVESLKDTGGTNEPVPDGNLTRVNPAEDEPSSTETTCSDFLVDPLVLVCRENSLRLFSAKSLIQGNKKPTHKVKLSKSCCWTTTLKKDEKICGLLLLLQIGTFEIRSFPNLELVQESSLLSILRWNYKVNMEKTMCSDDDGNIAVANGSELTFISLLDGENEFRSQENLPCLHDKVLAAAAFRFSWFDSFFLFAPLSGNICHYHNSPGIAPGILGGIVKGFKGGKKTQTDSTAFSTHSFAHLDSLFLKPISSDSPVSVPDNEVELNIDDIEIDYKPQTEGPTASIDVRSTQKDKLTDRDKLLQGGTNDDIKPRMRTPEEIRATYRKAGDASSAAAQARNKLMERQEKLERISERTAELQNGAENFASLANELVKTMERRKWWQI